MYNHFEAKNSSKIWNGLLNVIVQIVITFLFLIGINTGLRVNYLLKMEKSEILKLKRKKRKEFKVKEGKTKKERIINITSIFEVVLPYAEDLKST